MSQNKKPSQNTDYILPLRNIPFDFGLKLSEDDIDLIEKYIVQKNFIKYEIPALLKSLSDDILFMIKINQDIILYIYSYGIGVFTLKDDKFIIQDEKYANNYCKSRKEAHHQLLAGKHKYSELIYEIISELRNIVHRDKKKAIIRESANENWEHHGFSYIMTVTVIQKEEYNFFNYVDFSEIEKKNLMIMLEPGIVHQDDTMSFQIKCKSDINEKSDIYNFRLPESEPINWVKSKDIGIYISWAAVVVYMNKINEDTIKHLEYMEVDLQAMWMYIYCLYYRISHHKNKNIKISVLKKKLFTFQRKYNEFKSPNDTSMAEHFTLIRNELIGTSGIDNEKDKYISYLQYCIDETESLNDERSKKYSVLSEILLFIIAYVQIAPMLYNCLMGEFSSLGFWQVLIIILIAITGIVLIIRKD